jgi:hypothetical protein
MAAKNAVGFGLELGGFLLVAAASWISVALGAISIAGLIAGWLSYEITPDSPMAMASFASH